MRKDFINIIVELSKSETIDSSKKGIVQKLLFL